MLERRAERRESFRVDEVFTIIKLGLILNKLSLDSEGVTKANPEVSGACIGSALVRAFLGALMCHGFVGPPIWDAKERIGKSFSIWSRER